MNEELLDDENLSLTVIPKGRLFSILATINACLSIMLGMSLGLIIYNKLLGLPSSEVAFIYIYITFSVLCFTGIIFTVLSFVRNERTKTLKWLVGVINALFFILVLTIIASVIFK